jgi:hypothetical protein
LCFCTELLCVGFVITYSEFGYSAINVFENDIFDGLFYVGEFLGVGVGFFIFIIGYSIGELRPSGNIQTSSERSDPLFRQTYFSFECFAIKSPCKEEN